MEGLQPYTDSKLHDIFSISSWWLVPCLSIVFVLVPYGGPQGLALMDCLKAMPFS